MSEGVLAVFRYELCVYLGYIERVSIPVSDRWKALVKDVSEGLL